MEQVVLRSAPGPHLLLLELISIPSIPLPSPPFLLTHNDAI